MNFLTLWPYLRPLFPHLLLGSLLIIVTKFLEAFIPVGVGEIVNIFTTDDVTGAKWNTIANTGLFFTYVVLASLILELIVAFYRNWISEKGQKSLREHLYSHLLNQPLNFHDKERVGKLMTQTVHDVEKIREMLADSIIPMIGTISLLITILVWLFIINPTVALGVITLLPITIIFFIFFRKKQKKAYDSYRLALTLQNSFLQEHILGHNTIRSFQSIEQESEKFYTHNQKCYTTNLTAIDTFVLFLSSIDLLIACVWIGSFTLFAFLASPQAPFQAGYYYVFSLWGLQFYRQLSDFAERYNVFLSGMAALKKIQPLLKLRGEENPPHLKKLSQIETITFENVWFGYEEGKDILKGISFHIHSKEAVGLVGVTGAGKSTILNLLLRFYTPQKGTIYINDLPIDQYDLDSLRQQCSLVLQDPLLFSGTIEENIRFWREHIEIPSSPIPNKPLSYPVDELGKNLSEGEKQLINLSRATLANSSLLLLDEATSSVDPASEQKIQLELSTLLKQKTALIIAHRLTTLKTLDKIIVLHEGTIVEEGSYDILMKKEGVFYNLWKLLSL